METIAVPCLRCGAIVEIIPIGDFRKAICDRCDGLDSCKKLQAWVQNAPDRAWRRAMQAWAAYQDTEWHKLPCRITSAQAMSWQWGRVGLDLFGEPRTGKTRTMLLILEREHRRHPERTVKIHSPISFADSLEAKGWNSAAWEKSLIAFDILALDDFDARALSPIGQTKLFAIVEGRCARGAPTILTHNTTPEAIGIKHAVWKPLAARLQESNLFMSVEFKP